MGGWGLVPETDKVVSLQVGIHKFGLETFVAVAS